MSLVHLLDLEGRALVVDPAVVVAVVAGTYPATSILHTVHGPLVVARGTTEDVIAVLRGAEPSAPSLREEPATQPDLGAAGEVLRDIPEPRS